ncbi:hypothetical protein Tco_0557375 [Tanacetum coccineum]
MSSFGIVKLLFEQMYVEGRFLLLVFCAMTLHPVVTVPLPPDCRGVTDCYSTGWSPITPPPLSESSLDIEIATPVVASGALEMPPTGSTFEVGGPSYVSLFPIFYQHGCEILRLNDNTEILFNNVNYLERREKKRQAETDANSSEIRKVKKRMNDFDLDLGDEVQFSNFVENRVAKLEDKDQEKTEKVEKMEKRLKTLEINYALGAMDTCPDDGVDGSAAFGESQPPKPPGSPSGSQ